jgi:hypothetical protein
MDLKKHLLQYIQKWESLCDKNAPLDLIMWSVEAYEYMFEILCLDRKKDDILFPITQIPYLPENVEHLMLNMTSVLYPNYLPRSLRTIEIKNYNINQTLILPPQLEVLTIVGSKYQNILPAVLPSNLVSLNLYNVYTSNLPELPSSLRVLVCHNEPRGSGLSTMPNLPSLLEILDVQGNSLTNIESLPPKLERLNCDCNELSEICDLPASLSRLCVSENNLTMLPRMPPNLVQLCCIKNRLTDIPVLPASLKYLYYSDNPIVSHPELPKGIRIVNTCDDNY